jgi:CBS domain-containing protein
LCDVFVLLLLQVSESGELVGNVSATDVRVAAATGWQELTALLAKPLRDFLKFKASLMLTINERASHPRPITGTCLHWFPLLRSS